MNKAKMTFRFEQTSPGSKPAPQREAKVIPLHQEEYRIIEEKAEAHPEQEARSVLPSGTKPVQPKEPLIVDGQTLNQYTTDYGGWQSSFDTDTQRVERLIRGTGAPAVNPETGYVERERGPQREEELRDHRWYEPKNTGYYTRPSNGSWFKVTASVAGAVVTGVAFGFLVLSMFSGGGDPGKAKPADVPVSSQQPAKKSGDTAAPAAAQGKPADGAGAAAAKPADPAAGGASPVSAAIAGMGTAAVNVQPKSYTFLQGGVFSTAQSAEAAQADFRKKGFAAAGDGGDKNPVYVGMAVSRDDAQALSQQYKQKKIDVLLKTFDVPGASKIRWNGKSADVFTSYISQGEKLLQLISVQTTQHLNEVKPTGLDDKAFQTIKSSHQAWSSSASAVSDGLGEAGKASLPKMNSALGTALVSLEEYKKNPSVSYLWQAQTALMQYLVAEKDLLKTASVQ
ncbi:hypothetical protein O9H85_13075 [Paenibacillus filicis]|uniref:SPOR domain-containing protein n=1 Tax=Paenibacillus gyeongsangnamensis TaxID=3388067 RepID=A0ABT4Q8Z2_9BACL|nr:hypothetical protein [Paenibacillus filicis]MCZ8513342.1 hypothetical protein [Paenibacillus filicis]